MPRTPTIVPMEALLVDRLPEGKDWRYEPKWDGFRCLADKRAHRVTLRSKSGKPLERYFPDIVSRLENLAAQTFILDGELLVEGENGYSFSDLQLRLHPAASRVKMLAEKQPATFVIFDLLETDEGVNMMSAPLSERRVLLERFWKTYYAKDKAIKLSPQTDSLTEAMTWLNSTGWYIDGIVAKKMTDGYVPGERVMQKYKAIRTADCVVGGFRYGADSHEVGSLLLGLYDNEGRLNHVGFTSGIPKAEKPALTKQLEQLIQEPGFTGNAPGAPSRWSTERSAQWKPLLPKLVVEVSFDHVTDNHFRHGTKLIRFRPDKSPKQCTMEQLSR
ncbi:ATP-dependent DNA ligase [Nitrospira moscoviensis]|uniref:DNA ligase (ATP) n=1 Tax=Nitrospira moscoviensis TaxID=42253 RepID=A0A0K2GAF7_NITMO|nr:ATP-dependent DNA ligase [Nitrospira moscoviensis]ALA57946.1 ATP dependent DNA ligase [Nitrospira moscoviensis]